ncbi:hypothetical protein DACRYDRAFT_116765 [Dacryopinax primogenitus]|uniref:Sphingomyelin phosphodiesterase n=1 Tax=Dacryopinax primogenitus (strain DJM 731) TaxID=1858805 RepID=M5GAD6_DACPD|nr:uncharacterized protein DACRYDRAFT_116765 [Dacryopinax primogenitus]EJU00868.1 hypothetical protein DACRYDRAFT_116765 [Dacryopinax primogenitus]
MLFAVVALSLVAFARAGETSLALGSPTYVAQGVFPTEAFASYYNVPTLTDEQPQPVITNVLTGKVFAAGLTDPKNIPVNDTSDPRTYPPALLSTDAAGPLVQNAFNQIVNIANLNNSGWGNNCSRCLAGLEVAKAVALVTPESIPTLAVNLCNYFKFSTTCQNTYGPLALGQVLAQVLAAADVAGYDGQNICNNFVSGFCPLPPPSPLNMTGYFAKPKPANAVAPPPSGQRARVLHISDFHLDARYATFAEANCTSSLCCRANNPNSHSLNQVLLPAPRYGWFTCDTPYDLALAALQAIPAVTGTEGSGFDFTIFTGDLVSHDPENELSQTYVEYTETVLYDLYKKYLGSGPIYAAIGNHDSYNQAEDAPALLGTQLGQANLSTQFSWNYDTLSTLWENNDWISSDVAAMAKAHYGAYSVARPDGLRIITINTDLWYKANYFNYINMTKSDPSGMLRFVADELQEAEDAGERAWIIGHVLSGWDGSNPLNNPTNLFYQIVDRYAPHVIAGIFFGHTHEDQFQIFYANNATNISAASAGAVAWIAPSITPLTNLNSGFRMYEIDAVTFDILDAHTWYTNISATASLDNQTAHGPKFVYEYSTRQAYGKSISWPASAPLNATWWHKVTEEFEQNPALIQQFTTYQGKTSVLSPNCTSAACVAAKICYMRSGSGPIGKTCTQGFGSVQ